MDDRRPDRSSTWTEFALGVGGFGIGIGEFAIMGVLPDVARDLAISVPDAGHVISAYALGVVIGAPVIAILSAKLARRTILLGLMMVFALGNIASALASTDAELIAVRFLTGLPHGAYFGVASLVAAALAGPVGRARAVGRVMLGLMIATLVGTPLATWFGQALGWRAIFASVAVIGLLTVVLIWRFVPADRPDEGASVLRELGAFRRTQVWLTLGIGATGFGGMFAIFSYITPTLVNAADIREPLVPFVLCTFGVGMILGNLIGSRLADRGLMLTIGGVLLWDVVVAAAFSITAHHSVLAVVNVLLVGTGSALVPALQTRLMDVAADAQTLAAALNHSAFNVANALGAWLGGLAIAAGYGWTATGWIGACLAGVGFAVFMMSVMSVRSEHRSAPQRGLTVAR